MTRIRLSITAHPPRGGRAGCVNTLPDPYMQTTAEDATMMLDMIYQAKPRWRLIAPYPGEITQEECQSCWT